jgi:hypothetical protein
MQAITQDHPARQKSNTSGDLRQHALASITAHLQPGYDEECCTRGHQRICMGPRLVPAPSPLKANGTTQNQREQQP